MKIEELFIFQLTESIATPIYTVEQWSTNKGSVEQNVNDIINKNCKSFLNQAGDKKLYRGIGDYWNKDYYAFYKSPRNNRQPRNSTSSQHTLFTQLVNKAGKKANRDNSFFVTGNLDVAHFYGINGGVYSCYPIGDFSYTWSTILKDWQVDYGTVLDFKAYNGIPNFKSARFCWRFFVTNLNSFSNKKPITNYNQKIKKAFLDFIITLKLELLNDQEKINEFRSYVDNNQFDLAAEFIDDQNIEDKEHFFRLIYELLNEIRFDEVRDSIKGDDNSLSEAISSGKEIMISCNNAIFVNLNPELSLENSSNPSNLVS